MYSPGYVAIFILAEGAPSPAICPASAGHGNAFAKDTEASNVPPPTGKVILFEYAAYPHTHPWISPGKMPDSKLARDHGPPIQVER